MDVLDGKLDEADATTDESRFADGGMIVFLKR